VRPRTTRRGKAAQPNGVPSSRCASGVEVRWASRWTLSWLYQWRVSHASQDTAPASTIHNAIPGAVVVHAILG